MSLIMPNLGQLQFIVAVYITCYGFIYSTGNKSVYRFSLFGSVLLDDSLLESALETAFSTVDGQEHYPTKEKKGARIGYSLISNHAFVDGNKRIGAYVMLTFLEVNGIRLDCTNKDVVHIGLSVADGSMDYETLLGWIREHRI